jgi:type VI secretion system secreted protein VgrG
LGEALSILQSRRLLKITSPLGPDVLVLRRLSVQEAIGRPFEIGAELVSTRMDLAPASLVGKPITCSVQREGEASRHFHGIVRAFQRLGPYGRGLAAYRLEAVPRLWQLSRTSDCRIFQDKSVKEILTLLFEEHDVQPVRWGSAVPTQKRPYCVQFNETDLDFVQRLLEEVGCGYWFEHTETNHTLVIAGANSDYPLTPIEALTVRQDSDRRDALTRWKPFSALKPGKVRALDFDGLKPNALLDKQTSSVLTGATSALEIYHWPGGQAVRPDMDPSKLGMEVFEAMADIVTAAGSQPELHAGGRIKVLEGIDATSPVTWLLREVTHEAFDETQLSGGGTAGYSNGLTLMAADRPWRPDAPRPRPLIPSVQTAIVTGPPGEDIHTDEFGRVKLRFLWDRLAKNDDTSSCWARVAQSFGGAWGGSWTLPRVGDEVLVAFLDGDPDRPIVIGAVYNAEQKPIYALPANKTQSGIRTRSSKGGGRSNFNELRFEDKKGAEEIHVQAEKDLTILVKNDRTEKVVRHRTETVDGKHTETTKLDRTATVTEGHEKLTINKGNMTTQVDLGNYDRLVKTGNISEKASLGKIEIEAMQSITLKCGTSKIHMTPTNITIEAMMIKVDAKMMLETKGGMMAKHEAGALMIIKSGLVLIN